MKKVMLLSAMLGAFAAFAQPTSDKKEEVEIEVDGNKVIIITEDPGSLKTIDLNKVVAEVYQKAATIEKNRAEAHERIDKQLRAGEITEEEAAELKEQANERAEESAEVLEDVMEAWGDAYEERWEAWANQYEARMEAWEAEMEARTESGQSIPPMPALPPLPPMPTMDAMAKKEMKRKIKVEGDSTKTVIINEEGIIIKRKGNNEEPFALRFETEEELDEEVEVESDEEDEKNFDRTDGYLDIFFLGFNQQLVNGNQMINSNSSEALDFWRSTSFSIGTGWKTRLGNPYSKFYLKYGIELSAHNFRLTGNNQIDVSTDTTNPGVVFGARPGVDNFDKSKYYISYFNIPLMLQFDCSEVGERDESLTIGVGGYAGIRMTAKRELTYANAQFEEVEEKSYADFSTNRYRYGLMAQVGWDAFKVTASYDINPFFEENRGPSYNMFNVSLGLTL